VIVAGALATVAVVLVAAVVVRLLGDDPAAGDDRGGPDAPADDGRAAGEEETPGSDEAGARLAWTVDLSEETPGTPATDGERAYVSDETGRLTAIDMASGSIAWQVDLGDDAASGSPVVAGDIVIASASEPAVVQALDAATGAVRWSVPELWASDPPVVVGDTVVMSAGFEVAALALADGSIRWRTSEEDMFWTGPILAGDLLVGGTSDGMVVALDPSDGAIRWRTPLPRGDITVWSIAAVGDTVLAYDDDSFVTGMPAATGADPWTVDAGATFPGAMVTLGSDAAVYLDSDELLVLDPTSGAERRRIGAGSTTMLNLLSDPPLLIVSSLNSLQALEPDGSPAWTTEVPIEAFAMGAGPGALVVTDLEGMVAGYRLDV
jgi:outer membrane protein assembly factor BamB